MTCVCTRVCLYSYMLNIWFCVTKGVVGGFKLIFFSCASSASYFHPPCFALFLSHPYISFHLLSWQLCLISTLPLHLSTLLLTLFLSHSFFIHPVCLSSFSHFCLISLTFQPFLENQPHPPSLLHLQFFPCYLSFSQFIFFHAIFPPLNSLKTYPSMSTQSPHTTVLCYASPFELFSWCYWSLLWQRVHHEKQSSDQHTNLVTAVHSLCICANLCMLCEHVLLQCDHRDGISTMQWHFDWSSQIQRAI